jgi:hypothetical protein
MLSKNLRHNLYSEYVGIRKRSIRITVLELILFFDFPEQSVNAYNMAYKCKTFPIPIFLQMSDYDTVIRVSTINLIPVHSC